MPLTNRVIGEAKKELCILYGLFPDRCQGHGRLLKVSGVSMAVVVRDGWEVTRLAHRWGSRRSQHSCSQLDETANVRLKTRKEMGSLCGIGA